MTFAEVLDAIRTWVATDPDKLGLAQLFTAGDHVAIAARLNAPSGSAQPVAVSVDPAVVAQALDATDLRALAPEDRDVLRVLLTTPGEVTPAQLAGITALFRSGSASATGLQALAARPPLNRELLGILVPIDIAVVGAALGPLAIQPPSDPRPTRTYARFVIQKDGTIHLPALASGTLLEDTPFVVTPYAGDDEGSLPRELTEGVTYYVMAPAGSVFSATDKPGSKSPIVCTPGAGLIEFPGYQLKQVSR